MGFEKLHVPVQPIIDYAIQAINSVGPITWLYIGASFGLFILGGVIKTFVSR